MKSSKKKVFVFNKGKGTNMSIRFLAISLVSLWITSSVHAQTAIKGGYTQGEVLNGVGPIVNFCNKAQGSLVANGEFIWFGATDFVYRFQLDQPLRSVAYDLYVGRSREFSGTQAVVVEGSVGDIYLIAEQVAISGYAIPLPGLVIYGGKDRPSLRKVEKSEFDDECYELTKVDLTKR